MNLTRVVSLLEGMNMGIQVFPKRTHLEKLRYHSIDGRWNIWPSPVLSCGTLVLRSIPPVNFIRSVLKRSTLLIFKDFPRLTFLAVFHVVFFNNFLLSTEKYIYVIGRKID